MLLQVVRVIEIFLNKYGAPMLTGSIRKNCAHFIVDETSTRMRRRRKFNCNKLKASVHVCLCEKRAQSMGAQSSKEVNGTPDSVLQLDYNLTNQIGHIHVLSTLIYFAVLLVTLVTGILLYE
uniref:Uncharacterized protein n=1 Tax=Glossina austeni TaxID=7395 RepID=A0A1A9VXU1_GLOAU